MISPEVRQRVGGRWAVSLRLYLGIAPVAIAASIVFVGASPTPQGALATFAASVASYLVMGAVLLAANATVLRNRRVHPVSLSMVIAVGLSAGLARSISAMFFGALLGLPDLSSGDVVSRLVSGSLLGACLIPFGAYLMASVSDFRHERRRLVAERVAVRRAVDRDQEHVAELGALLASVGLDPDVLDDAASSLTKAVGGAEEGATLDGSDIASRLREVAEHTVRPVSHRLMGAAQDAEPPRLRLRSIVRAALHQDPFPIVPVLVIWLISSWPGEWARWGFGSSIVIVGSTMALIAIFYDLGRRLVRVWPAGRFVIFVAVMLTVVAAASAVAWAFVPGMTTEQLVTNALATAVWLPVLTLVTSIASSAFRQADELVANLAREVNEAQIELLAIDAEASQQLRRLARYLHADVQPRVLAAAWQVQSGNDDPSVDVSTRIEELAQSLRGIGMAMSLATEEAPGLKDVVDRWHGLVDVEIGSDVEQACAGPSREVVELIDEAVANAYRHGRARHVWVSCRYEQDRWVIVVDDDGKGPQRGEPGLGSAIYARACPGGWRLSPGERGGSRVELRL